jgi:hypothetical protein
MWKWSSAARPATRRNAVRSAAQFWTLTTCTRPRSCAWPSMRRASGTLAREARCTSAYGGRGCARGTSGTELDGDRKHVERHESGGPEHLAFVRRARSSVPHGCGPKSETPFSNGSRTSMAGRSTNTIGGTQQIGPSEHERGSCTGRYVRHRRGPGRLSVREVPPVAPARGSRSARLARSRLSCERSNRYSCSSTRRHFQEPLRAARAAGANDAWCLLPAELLRHGFFRDAVIALPVV